MNLKYINELNNAGFGGCDLDFINGNQLHTAVLMSLLSNRRADTIELDSPTDSREGWWAEQLYSLKPKFGSKLWLLKRKKILYGLDLKIKQYCTEAIQWMVDYGLCASLDVHVERDPNDANRINILIIIHQNDGTKEKIAFADLWKMID